MNEPKGAHLDADHTTIVINQMSIQDKDVAREAQRWTAGERGEIIDDPAVLADADLSGFVTEAVKIGAHALSATGQSQDARALERMIKEAGDKTAATSTQAAELTERTVKDATKTMTKAAEEAKKAIVDADQASRKEFTDSVATAKNALNAELRRIFAGDSPELLEKLQPLLDKFSSELDAKSAASISEVVTKAVKQFDPADPTSPMAKHTATLEARQLQLTDLLGKNHQALSQKIDEISTAVKVHEARTNLSKVTPIKGDTFETQVNEVLTAIATGLGDEYTDTRAVVGQLPRSKKGDGLLAVDGGTARVVIEMSDSARGGWTEYLDEAERNRHAAASLGLVRTPEQNAGQSIRVIGSRRIIMAFDPTIDEPDLVRTVVILLRTAALAAGSRRGAEQLSTAEEKIAEAIAQLDRIDDIKKAAGAIHKNADKIETGCTAVTSGINRLLSEALAALADAQAVDTTQASGDNAA
ncbi:Fis family transcriptional regulator [Mycolicibacterium neoaurum]|uniref:Fis family transcriptional regulator n=1 Tax=Mycolicibacterium neoaurum TaxID=1795 RepID=UPI00248D0170|nr:Fis family transcriptional regulator [Mycolicibacterium neoaurum]WBP94047.1 Fis family transcriptional regulator [Mycolicibacterium neoaurum]WBS07185.1 Fis family transcriptional regulator [Mycolicibacterium neoaurum]